MHLSACGLLYPRWTNEIHEEWIRNLLEDHPDITRLKAERIRQLMDAHVLDSLVSGYEDVVSTLELPDPDDRHVLAAAIKCGATGIVTFNTKDFPEVKLTPHNVEAVHPDDFVIRLLEIQPETVSLACARHRATLLNPPKSVEEYLAILKRAGFVQSVNVLEQTKELL